ncbi:MAG: glutamate--tRNA ligase [Desulfovibrio sp.]|jgi:glutamyl-tRNA synthetase|nr:glutamate--tRNA ligase [Desulfovibrio sp.]
MTQVVTRFAPSPTGHLHIGGARTAIFSWLLARHNGGKFHLRIEDTDLARSRQEYTDSILASMQWLGLDWDAPPMYQTQRTQAYDEAVEQLLRTGHAYWCACTPEEVEAMREKARAEGTKPRYDGRCRDRGLGKAPGSCVRLRLPDRGVIAFRDMVKGDIGVDVAELDDMVIRRADGMPTYNMAVVVDDSALGVTHVLRGDDHISNTPRQIVLYQALGLPVPIFGHVPMILGSNRQKLSKRDGARAVIEYEQDGLLPDALVNYLARLGWSHGNQELFSREELVEFFDGTNLNPSAAAFDPAKLDWCNAQHMRSMPLETLADRVRPFVEAIGLQIPGERALIGLCKLFRERATTLKALAEAFRPLLIGSRDLAYAAKDATKHLGETAGPHLAAFAEIFGQCEPFTADALDAAFNAYVADNGLQFKTVAPVLRTALMGFMGGGHLDLTMEVLGREETLARLAKAAAWRPEVAG